MITTRKFFLPKLLIVLIAGVLFSCQSGHKDILIIATAANGQFAIAEIASEFAKETGIECQVIIGSSGKHTAQIEAGAPYDVFVSADIKFPAKLHMLGLTIAEPKIYAYGKLVIWTLNDSLSTAIESLTTSTIKHIAMPNPKTAPYGRAAKEALDFHNLYGVLRPYLVFGESVAQTNQFILSKSASIGFTAASVVMAPAMKNKGWWQEVKKDSYTPIAQGAVVIKHSNQIASAEKFYLFLFSPKAKKVFQAHGYSTDNNPL